MAAAKGIVNGICNKYDGISNRFEDAVKSDDQWVNLVKGILRAEMTRRGITYDQLAEKLKEVGVEDTAVNIRNKVARGGFSAVFFVQCLRAIGAKHIDVSDIG
ncbi:DUF6471 domain-containing protein [Mesorhizobium sp.]|uniref:DUF6471 domain-containing protein n=1 Tax=Mesorhizobium sp. TaxID=1871066 RepID=UPI0025795428|nr:DUF6471 domain-containing protein [Mesorhizobium sp.]